MNADLRKDCDNVLQHLDEQEAHIDDFKKVVREIRMKSKPKGPGRKPVQFVGDGPHAIKPPHVVGPFEGATSGGGLIRLVAV